MASDLSNLTTRRSNIYAELAAINSTTNGGKPSYSINGQQVDHVQYRLSLQTELDGINKQINIIQGPYEQLGQGIT